MANTTPKNKQGRFISNGVYLEKHEMATMIFLLMLGYDIELIPKSNKKDEQTADLKMSALLWEMKSPKGSGKYLTQNTLHRAAHQSENIILDLRRIKIHPTKCLQKFKKEFYLSKRLKRALVITKSHKLLEFHK